MSCRPLPRPCRRRSGRRPSLGAPRGALLGVVLIALLGLGGIGCGKGDREPDDDDLIPPRDVHRYPPPQWPESSGEPTRPGAPGVPPGTSAEPTAPERLPPPAAPITLAAVHAGILQPSCGACHIEASPPAGGLFLALDDGLPGRLLAPSIQLPDMARVAPGEPDASYLMHKVDGTHEAVGGTGGRCPLGGPPLSSTVRDRLLEWIDRQPDPHTLR